MLMRSADPLQLRLARAGDAPAIGGLAERSGLFPAEMLAPMIAPFLTGDGGARWYVAERHAAVIGFLFSEPEMLTDGTHNLRAMATEPDARAQGVGSALIHRLERDLAAAGQRVLLVETSSAPAFAETRRFYASRGFREEARIAEFWAAGEDKVIFWKAIANLA